MGMTEPVFTAEIKITNHLKIPVTQKTDRYGTEELAQLPKDVRIAHLTVTANDKASLNDLIKNILTNILE